MIAIDTNILVRYAVKDDPHQTVVATDFLAAHSCFVLKTVLLELVWVLSSSSGYALSRSVVVERVNHILGLPNVSVQDPAHVALALEWYEAGMDFADALHFASSFEGEGFATFEKNIRKKAAQSIGHFPSSLCVLCVPVFTGMTFLCDEEQGGFYEHIHFSYLEGCSRCGSDICGGRFSRTGVWDSG